MPSIQKLNSIKPFMNIFNIEFYGFSFYFKAIFHTVSLQYIIQDDIFNTINLIIDYALTWDVELQSSYIINYWIRLNRVCHI